IEIAVSQTSDPRGGWFIYHLNQVTLGILAAGDLADYPTMGQNRQGIFVSYNDFVGGVTFNSSKVIFLPKAKMYAGAAIGVFNVAAIDTDTLQPANVMNPSEKPRAAYFLSSLNFLGGSCLAGCNELIFLAASNFLDTTGPGLELSSTLLPTSNSFFFPPGAEQPGCTSGTCLIDTGDARISGEVTYANGFLYGGLTTNGTGGGAGAARYVWFKVQPFLNDNDARCTGTFEDKCPQIVGAAVVNEDCSACTAAFPNAGAQYYP